MLKQYSALLTSAIKLLDLSIIFVSIILGTVMLIIKQPINYLNTYISLKPYLFNTFVSVFIWSATAHVYTLYSSKRIVGLLREACDILKIAVVSIIIFTFILVFLESGSVDIAFIVVIFASEAFPILLLRVFLRCILFLIRRMGYNFRDAVIIGSNTRSLALAKALTANKYYGIHVIGFVDDECIEKNSGINIIGSLDQLKDILKNNIVDVVCITLPIKSFYDRIEEVIFVCEQAGVKVKVLADIFQLKIARNFVSYIGDMSVIGFHSGPHDYIGLIIKRIIDVVLSSILLVLFLPLFIVVSVLIKLTSKGPAIFKQERVGQDHRIFKLYKFRSMRLDAEELKKDIEGLNEVSGPIFKIKNDPRITKVGRFIRKYSIDELPQLFNVLIGNMSLVGPRPPLYDEVKQYNWNQRRKLSMKPGITCLWQVNGRSKLSFEEWMRLDLEYIDNWSLKLDFIILIKTIPVVLEASGAY